MRGRKIFIVAHCVLNVNSKVEGLSPYESMMGEVIDLLRERGYGIIQLPCPEMLIYGINRWGHSREQFDNTNFRKTCRRLFEPVMEQIINYKEAGYTIGGIIGIDGSPSCGVNMTWSAPQWKGELNNRDLSLLLADGAFSNGTGIFMEEIRAMLDKEKLPLRFFGINEENPSACYEDLKMQIDK